MTRDMFSESVWEDAGRRVAARLDDISSAVVVGRDARFAALAALGIARLQSARRRVAVGDLVGDTEVLQALVTDDDVHGIVDSFVYGVSLNRIARPVEGYPNLFILPSGSEPVAQLEVFRNTRWRRLSGGFQEVGALLLLVVTDDAPGLTDLIANTDGAILVGTEVVLGPEVTTLATVVPQRRSAPLITPERGVPRRDSKPPQLITPNQSAPAALQKSRLAIGTLASKRHLVPIAAGAAIGLILVAVTVVKKRAAEEVVPARAAASDTSRAVVSGEVDPNLPIVIANPQDSARASGWSVRVVAHNTEAGALNTVRETLSGLPAPTYAPMVVTEGARWYQVFAGAFQERGSADSLLRALREARTLEAGQGQVAERPLLLAIRLRTGLSLPDAARAKTRYLAQGIPAYGLVQDDGTVTLYTGAFESEVDASLAIPAIRSTYPEIELAYRTGRP